jgi:uncharacterized protein with FMN-binding domain
MSTSPDAAPTSDDQLAERLARLRQRRQPADTAQRSTRPRRHPAAGARAAALVLTLATTGGLGALFANLSSAQAASQAIGALPAPVPTGASTTAAMATAAAPQAFDGRLVTTKYGPVQVQVQISGGTIADVAVVAYPDTDRESRSINATALPRLRTEVLAAQSAAVETVSGATYTSTAYSQSLQSAIDAARAAGATSIA